MNQGIILHLFGWDKKFVLPFRKFVQKNFADNRHRFIIYGAIDTDVDTQSLDTVTHRSLLRNLFTVSRDLNAANKIILHGLFNGHLLYILTLQPWLLKKCHWVIWGGDLYEHEASRNDWRWQKNEFVRRFLIKRLGHLVTYVPGDAQLARKWYGAKGQYHECLMYTSNVYHDYEVKAQPHTTVNIQIGNSADPSNNHFEILEKLKPFRDQDIAIYAPLSYGDQAHAKSVIDAGIGIFGNKFKPMTDFMPFAKYLEFLGQIDIAVFAHKRQQAMGNTITLLGLGKKVYMRSDVTPWTMFDKLGIKVFDFSTLNSELISKDIQERNIVQIKMNFNFDILIRQLSLIFYK